MRIIAGEAGGRKLFAPTGADTRPTSDRTRGALFNILSRRVAGAYVLDVFSGTGALALEALSRGAERAVAIDSGREAVRAMERNALAVLGEDWRKRLRILKMDYRQALASLAGDQFDLIFLDPPYRMADAYAGALRFLENLTAPDARIVLERAKTVQIPLPEGYRLLDSRAYGESALDFVAKGV